MGEAVVEESNKGKSDFIDEIGVLKVESVVIESHHGLNKGLKLDKRRVTLAVNSVSEHPGE
jgi:hypothetical protein